MRIIDNVVWRVVVNAIEHLEFSC